jgi:hypothetical protein
MLHKKYDIVKFLQQICITEEKYFFLRIYGYLQRTLMVGCIDELWFLGFFRICAENLGGIG